MDVFFNPSKNRSPFDLVIKDWIKRSCGTKIENRNFASQEFPCANLIPFTSSQCTNSGLKKSQNMLYLHEPEHAMWENESVCHQHLIFVTCFFVQR